MSSAATRRLNGMDWKLELIVVPVADIDRAKAFYLGLDWDLIVDHRAGEDFRVVQLNPPASACAIALMKNPGAAGSLGGLHLVVSDIDAAHGHLSAKGADPSGPFHFEEGRQVDGPDTERQDYNSFLSFDDPDGNSWLVQEVHR